MERVKTKINQVGKNLVVFIYRLSSSSIFLSRLFIKLFSKEVLVFFSVFHGLCKFGNSRLSRFETMLP